MKTIYAVDDNGHSHHKVAYLEDGVIKTLKIPTAVGDGSSPITNLSGISQSTYRINGHNFCCTEHRQTKIDVRNQGYQSSDENKALVAHVLYKAGLQGKPISLGVTVPWREAYSKNGGRNSKRMDEVAAHFKTGEMINLTNGEGYDLQSCTAYPEGLAAFFDWAIGEDGSIDTESSQAGPIAVVDIGGSTTDIATVVSDEELGIDHDRSNTKKIGVLDAKEMVRDILINAIHKSTGVNPESDGGIPERMVESLFAGDPVTIGDVTYNLSDEVREAKASVAAHVVSFVKTTIGNPLLYEAVLFVGGGAIVFEEELRTHFRHAIFKDEFSNARGALKYMLKVDRPTST
jgi:plasmid segregation protein ParM